MLKIISWKFKCEVVYCFVKYRHSCDLVCQKLLLFMGGRQTYMYSSQWYLCLYVTTREWRLTSVVYLIFCATDNLYCLFLTLPLSLTLTVSFPFLKKMSNRYKDVFHFYYSDLHLIQIFNHAYIVNREKTGFGSRASSFYMHNTWAA